MLSRIAAIVLFSLAGVRAESWYFIQMSDPQFGMFAENRGFEQETANFEFAIATANRLKPVFVVVTGDLINKTGDPGQAAEYHRVAAKLDRSIPLYAVAGNHDVGNEPTLESLARYRENFGRDYYTFRAHHMEGVVLNGSLLRAPASAPGAADEQEKWLRQELDKARRDRIAHVVIFIHQPFFLESASEPDQYFNVPLEIRRRYLALFHEYGVEHIFAGHYHRNAYGRDGSLEMVTTGPVGKPIDKDPSGLRIVTVRDGRFDSRYYGFGFLPPAVE